MKTKILFLAFFLGFIVQISGQTIKEGSVVVMNTYKFALNPDVTMNQWMNFYKTKYIPEYEKAYPGIKVYLLWGNRGENKNEIGILYTFESVAIRDKYYPTADAETSSEAVKIAGEKLKAINSEMGKYVLAGAPRTYTDWIVR